MRYDEDPARDADRSDEDAEQARAAEDNREVDDDGNHSTRVDEPAERGVSEDDGGEEDRPDPAEVNRRILEANGLTPDEGWERLVRERGVDPDLPTASHIEAFQTGFAGQVLDPTPNEAYTVSGQATGEAAAQDRMAAMRIPAGERAQLARGRTGDDE